MSKLPPIEKIYEAYSAIADDRVTLFPAENRAVVKSSNGAKEYQIAWRENTYVSNDSATYWQGYPGYPIIAVLMLQGKLTLNQKIAALFAQINWTELNKKHKRDYAAAVEAVIRERQLAAEPIHAAVKQVYEEIKTLTIELKRSLKK